MRKLCATRERAACLTNASHVERGSLLPLLVAEARVGDCKLETGRRSPTVAHSGSERSKQAQPSAVIDLGQPSSNRQISGLELLLNPRKQTPPPVPNRQKMRFLVISLERQEHTRFLVSPPPCVPASVSPPLHSV